jgi:hypothetical protein
MSSSPTDPATEEQLLCIGAVHEPDFSLEAMSKDLARAMRNESHNAEANARESLRLLDVLATTTVTAAACSSEGATLMSTAGVK